MYKNVFILILPFMLTITDTIAQKSPVKNIEWTLAAKLKNTGGSPSPGFAGAVNAVYNNVLIIAGGANFPDKKPWEGGKKYYSNQIHVLQRSATGFTLNKAASGCLHEAVAYCGNTVTDHGIVYAGGENESGLSRKVYIITYNTAQNKTEVRPLPDLPVAVTNLSLTHLKNTVYALGGDLQMQSSAAFFSMDLNRKNPQWLALPNLPVALANAVAVVQAGRIYVIGGRSKTAVGISELHNTTYAYDPLKRTWKSCAGISDGTTTTNLSAGAGVAVGDHSILLLGGDNGQVFHKIENYIVQISQTADPVEKQKLIAQKNNLSIHHNGFYRGLLLYNTITNTWKKIGELPFPAQVTTTATKWNNDIVLSNGEIKPGIRTPNIMLGNIK